MTNNISAINLRHHLGELLNRVNLRDELFVIERKGKPLAAIVPVWLLTKFGEEKIAFFKQVDNMRKCASKVSGKILDKTIDEAVRSAKKRK